MQAEPEPAAGAYTVWLWQLVSAECWGLHEELIEHFALCLQLLPEHSSNEHQTLQT